MISAQQPSTFPWAQRCNPPRSLSLYCFLLSKPCEEDRMLINSFCKPLDGSCCPKGHETDSRQARWWEEVWRRRKGCWGLEWPHEGSGESLMSAGPQLVGSSGGLRAWAKCPPHTWLAPSSRARTMGSKPWEFPQDLGVNSGSSTYSCMTLGTVLKKPHLQRG